MRFRPCIDLHDGKVKQIVGGTLTDSSEGLVENFVSSKSAQYYAEMFKNDNLKGGHVIMLGSGNQEVAIKALRSYPGGLHIGGGINNENAAFYLENGASHVIVTSYVFRNGEIDFENLNKIVSEVGKEKLVLDLSCRKKDQSYFVVTDRWQKFTDFAITSDNITELSTYCDEFLIHAVDVEGKNRGINEELVAKLGQWVDIPTTYAGGASTLEDIIKLKELGRGKLDLTIGSALDIYGGKLSYKEVLECFN